MLNILKKLIGNSNDDEIKDLYKIVDKINLQIMSRTYLASSNDNRKKFKFAITIKKKNKVLLDRELTYNKKISSATSLYPFGL